LLKHDLRYTLTVRTGERMKNLETVLREKQLDVERVRQEVQALLVVIPLLADEQPSSDEVMHLLAARLAAEPPDNGMADLELYFPFVKGIQRS
jgi:hypothetical protein